MSINNDTKFLLFNNELRDLRNKQEKLRPTLYFLFCAVLVVIGIVLIPSPIMFCPGVFALASLFVGVDTVEKRRRINERIRIVQLEITRLTAAQVGAKIQAR